MVATNTAMPPRRRAHGPLALGALVAVATLCTFTRAGRWAVLLNTTPSEPLGLYGRAAGVPGPGRLVAFPAPLPAFPYADRRLAYLHRTPLLKGIVAGPGDQVCTLGGQLVVNGRRLAAIADNDSEGRTLPHWTACRAMRDGELFAYSDRAPNSFDSRYFGPVPAASVIGVYRPLFVIKETR